MFYFVVFIISVTVFLGVFALWILFWSFAMSANEQGQIESVNQGGILKQS